MLNTTNYGIKYKCCDSWEKEIYYSGNGQGKYYGAVDLNFTVKGE